MADIRALMAQERQARRINHEFASYSKAGALMCTACELNVRSESLWEGHLKSANHKANVRKLHQAPRVSTKRKIEDVDESGTSDDVDGRKKLKPKSRIPSETISAELPDRSPPKERSVEQARQVEATSPDEDVDVIQPAKTDDPPPVQAIEMHVDEDEWAAFERDIAPLAQPDYSAATITAAPVSAAQLEAEAESDRRKLRDTEAEDEKEDEGRRIEEEFEVMEEMEERIRKLREKREALRLTVPKDIDTGQSAVAHSPQQDSTLQETVKELSDDSEDDVDDWYS